MPIKNQKNKTIIAIDGPAGAGKTTISRLVANHLGFTYIDTGAMYRAVALKAYENGIDTDDEKGLESICKKIKITFKTTKKENRIFVNGKDWSEKIRQPFVGEITSRTSAKPRVREAMVKLQRRMGRNGKVVMEGRDIGTVVFPNARFKFYLDASPETRGKRRYLELIAKNEKALLQDIIDEIKKRDKRDLSREHSPLKMAKDAVYIDTSNMTINDVVEKMLRVIKERLKFGSLCC
ncbi:MAG: (d)CMP kinase [Deltaproteobacteria bacterium]|nr:(d)CMP kinase [Deltaproteobacteria bacterium]